MTLKAMAELDLPAAGKEKIYWQNAKRLFGFEEGVGPGRGTRTPTPLRAADFKSAASAGSAIPGCASKQPTKISAQGAGVTATTSRPAPGWRAAGR